MLAHPMIVRVAGGNPCVTCSAVRRSTRCGVPSRRCGLIRERGRGPRRRFLLRRVHLERHARSRSGSLPGRRTRRALGRAYAPACGDRRRVRCTPCREAYRRPRAACGCSARHGRRPQHRRTQAGSQSAPEGVAARSSRQTGGTAARSCRGGGRRDQHVALGLASTDAFFARMTWGEVPNSTNPRTRHRSRRCRRTAPPLGSRGT